jgi:predicted  nucleic acid-binding Zn-ribbon protein
VFGVTVAEAGFVGGQEYADEISVGRDRTYGLVVTYGLVGVRCVPSVVTGDYVVPNSRGVAKKSDGNYGYLVTAISDVNGTSYAMISLAGHYSCSQAIDANVQDLKERMKSAEHNIASVTNTATSAYAMAQEIKDRTDASIDSITDKVDGAVGKVESMEGVVGGLNDSVSNIVTDMESVKNTANNAVSSANSIKDEAVSKADQALDKATNTKNEVDAAVDQMQTDINNTFLEIQKTNEDMESARDQLQSNIDDISGELDDTKANLNNTRDELLTDINKISDSLKETDGKVAAVTTRVDENETSISEITAWSNETNQTITKIAQKTNDHASEIELLTAWKTDVAGDVSSIASIKSQSDANKSSIEGLTSWKGTTSETLTSVKQQSDDNKASIESITSWQGDTDKSIAEVKQQATNNGSSIANLTSWQEGAKTSIANVEQKASNNAAQIGSLVSWKDGASTAIANVEQKATKNETSITNLTSWQGDTNTAMAALTQKADANGAYIQGFVSNLDKYSYGPCSPTNTLSDEESRNILEYGMVYVPNKDHTESYDDGTTESPVTIEFLRGYYYIWTYDENDVMRWIPSSSVSVIFSSEYIAGSETTPYWVPEVDITHEGLSYETKCLYKWDVRTINDEQYKNWIKVATLQGNTNYLTTSLIKQASDSILMSVASNYVDNDSFQTELSIVNNSINMKFTETTDRIASVDNTSQNKFAQIYQYINFTGGSIKLGASDSATTLTIDNDAMKFDVNGVTLGEWTPQGLYTGNAIIRLDERLQIGNFAYVPRSDGSVMLLKVGD